VPAHAEAGHLHDELDRVAEFPAAQGHREPRPLPEHRIGRQAAVAGDLQHRRPKGPRTRRREGQARRATEGLRPPRRRTSHHQLETSPRPARGRLPRPHQPLPLTTRIHRNLDRLGIGGFHDLVAAHAEEPAQVVIGIETDRGLCVEALAAAGYQVSAINPLAVARYRDRHQVSGAKSDAGDAKVLADLVRTDRHNHRPIAGDTPQVEAIKVLARAHQSLIWARTRHTNTLRSALREYYPAALEAFDDLADRDALAILGRAPTPTDATGLSLPKLRSALGTAGRQRNLDARALQIQAALRTEQLSAPASVTAAFGATNRATVGIITELNRQIDNLGAELTSHFEMHPDADIYRSLPGLGVI